MIAVKVFLVRAALVSDGYRVELSFRKRELDSRGEEVKKIMCCSFVFLILHPVIQFLQQEGNVEI
jgi:hypothetical protein